MYEVKGRAEEQVAQVQNASFESNQIHCFILEGISLLIQEAPPMVLLAAGSWLLRIPSGSA